MAPISVVFRVHLIPPHITAKDLRLAFHLDTAHQSGIEIAEDSLVLLPSCTDRSTQTALVQFTPTYPDFLKKLAAGTTQTYTLKVPSWKTSLAIDTNFLGLTQLSPVPQNKATSEYVLRAIISIKTS